MYVDTVSTGDIPKAPEAFTMRLNGTLKAAGLISGLNQGFSLTPAPALELPEYARFIAFNWFPNDFATTSAALGSNYTEFNIPIQTTNYGFKALPEWGMRSAPGKLQDRKSVV